MIELARKAPKTTEKQKASKQQSVETLTPMWTSMSSNSLPSTQRLYVVWKHITHCGGMGELFEKCWITPIMDNYTLLWSNMEGQTWLVTFRQNPVKLAWAFISIMNSIHGILHNDLSKDNIMLHFLPDKLNVVYIGVCNWGEVGRLQEVMPSLYGFVKDQDAINTKKCIDELPQNCFLFIQVKNCKFPSTNGQATHHNFDT